MSFPDLSPPSLGPPGVASVAPAATGRAAAAPAAPQRPAAAPAPAGAAEVVEAVAEPLDELLQQGTEQTLHLNHVEGALREIAKSITDLGDATQAGLVEVRGLVAQGGARAPAAEGGGDWQKAMGERIDELEAAASRSGRMQTALLAVAGLELVALVFVILLETGAVSFKKKSEEFSFAPPPPVAAQPATAVAPAPLPLPEPAAPPKDTKARRRNKH